jgi:hypothetical protein
MGAVLTERSKMLPFQVQCIKAVTFGQHTGALPVTPLAGITILSPDVENPVAYHRDADPEVGGARSTANSCGCPLVIPSKA